MWLILELVPAMEDPQIWVISLVPIAQKLLAMKVHFTFFQLAVLPTLCSKKSSITYPIWPLKQLLINDLSVFTGRPESSLTVASECSSTISSEEDQSNIEATTNKEQKQPPLTSSSGKWYPIITIRGIFFVKILNFRLTFFRNFEWNIIVKRVKNCTSTSNVTNQ